MHANEQNASINARADEGRAVSGQFSSLIFEGGFEIPGGAEM